MPTMSGPTALVKLDLRYLFWAFGRHKRRPYWYYRRDGRVIAIRSPDGRRLQPSDAGFFKAYQMIHERFEQEHAEQQPANTTDGARTGTFAHLIEAYRASSDFTQCAPKTQKDYGRYLDVLKEKWGKRTIAKMPRDAVLALRDEYQATPRTANYIVAVLSLILTFAGDRRQTFGLPQLWLNPASRPKRLKTGEGHRPWEEVEIDAFRSHWPGQTLERAVFETFLNTGQRGEDVAPMIRRQYFQGEIAVAQEKTKKRVWIPASQDLRDVLDPWLKSNAGLPNAPIFRTEKGRELLVDHMRHVMRAAMRAAGLPDDCTLHGLRYTFATRAIELGLDWQTIESIVGHETAEMAFKYTQQRRGARLAIATLNQVRKANRGVQTPADWSANPSDVEPRK
jgi:integrase